MSELNNHFSKFINLINDNFFIFLDFLKNLYISIIKEINFISELNSIWLQLIEYLASIFKIIIARIDLEFTDIKVIFNSFTNSLSTNGKITAAIGLVILVILIFIVFFRPKINKSDKGDIRNKVKNNQKTKSKRTQLLEIEIDLLELQDKYTRNVISLNSYQTEARRLEAKASKVI